ncbi:uncharacterized protein LOC144468631 [Augochlora pura]
MSVSSKRKYDENDTCETLEDVESKIFKWIIDMSRLGYPIVKEHLINSMALQIEHSNIPNKFSNGQPSHQWFEDFLKRYPILTLSKTFVSEDFVRKWFQYIEDYLKRENLWNIDSSRIFNTDGTSLMLNPKVLAKKGFKNVDDIVNDNDKQNITVLFTANAEGQLAPTLIVYNCKKVPRIVFEKIPQGFCVSTSKGSWLTASSFYEYIVNKFWPWLIQNKIQMPVVLFLDGHASHLTQPLSEFCSLHQIVLIPLPPNTAHFLRPMDVNMFTILKSHWKKKVNQYRIEKEITSINKEDFAPVLETVYRELNLKGIISDGFKECGLDPFYVHAIDLAKIFQRKTTSSSQPVIRISIQPWILEIVEKFIDETTLRTFKSEKSDRWTGRVADTNLFYLWRRIRDDCIRSRNIADGNSTYADSIVIPDVSNSQSDQDECIIGF